MNTRKGSFNVFILGLGPTIIMRSSVLADASWTKANQAAFYMNSEILQAQKLFTSQQGCSLQQTFVKSIILQKNKFRRIITNIILLYLNMKKTSLQVIHLKNLNFNKVNVVSGAFGQRHSKLIDKLSSQVEIIKKENKQSQKIVEPTALKQQALHKKLIQFEKEETNLKREMIRMSQMAKSYKNSKIEMELKNQSLINEIAKLRKENDELKTKTDLLNQLNLLLMKITENSLQILPHYEKDCQVLFSCIEHVKSDMNDSIPSTAVKDLKNQLEIFKKDISNIQLYNKKLIHSLSEAKQETRSLSQRISLLSDFDMQTIINLKSELNLLNQQDSQDQQQSAIEKNTLNLGFQSHLNEYNIIPQETSRINKILQDICLLFDQHIHVLQSQKMQYQFIKNKKLITAQKYQCQICQNYQKIVSHIFSIVRQAFKQIKFQFLREIKQVVDISEITFLI